MPTHSLELQTSCSAPRGLRPPVFFPTLSEPSWRRGSVITPRRSATKSRRCTVLFLRADGRALIRSCARTGLVPAAALTAYASPEDRLKALRAGYHDHLPKPVDPAVLVETVASLARRGHPAPSARSR